MFRFRTLGILRILDQTKSRQHSKATGIHHHRRYILPTSREKKRSKNQLVIDRVLTVVANRYNQDLTLSDVAEQVHLTPNYVGALFKSVVGESFVDYLTRYRMERAKELLGDIDKKIYEVSSAVGYNNISYFCTKFKNIYGLSPTEYREKVIRVRD